MATLQAVAALRSEAMNLPVTFTTSEALRTYATQSQIGLKGLACHIFTAVKAVVLHPASITKYSLVETPGFHANIWELLNYQIVYLLSRHFDLVLPGHFLELYLFIWMSLLQSRKNLPISKGYKRASCRPTLPSGSASTKKESLVSHCAQSITNSWISSSKSNNNCYHKSKKSIELFKSNIATSPIITDISSLEAWITILFPNSDN